MTTPNELLALSELEKLTSGHNLDRFDCGDDRVNRWLKKHALRNQLELNSPITYVVHQSARVVGYFALVVGEVALDRATLRVKQGMPRAYAIPVMKLAWLGVDRSVSGCGLGTALVKEAFRRTVEAADIAGIRAIVVDAIDDDAAKFYIKRGFEPSPIGPHQLFVRLDDVRAAIAESQKLDDAQP